MHRYIAFLRAINVGGYRKIKMQDLREMFENMGFEKFDFVDGDLFSLVNKKTHQKVNFSNVFVEKIIGIPGTNRNWKTVNKMLEMASD